MSLSDGVFDRTHRDVPAGTKYMSRNMFALATSGLTFAGIMTSFATATLSYEWDITGWTLIGFLALVLIVAIGGVLLSTSSNSPGISFLGYMLVAGPFGLMLGPVLAQYTSASVLKIFFITTAVVAILGVIGAIIPQNLEGLGSYFLVGMLVLIGGYFLVPIAAFLGFDAGGALTLLDWVGILLFSGMVVYDWNRAMRLPYTLDNAVDSALAVYLDWFNIFIRMLSALGGSSDD